MADNLRDTSQVDGFINRLERLQDGVHDFVQREAVFRSVALRDGKVFYLHLVLVLENFSEKFFQEVFHFGNFSFQILHQSFLI